MKNKSMSVLAVLAVPLLMVDAQEARPAVKQRPAAAPGGQVRPLDARRLEELKTEKKGRKSG